MDTKISDTKFKETKTTEMVIDVVSIKKQRDFHQALVDNFNIILERAEKVGIDITNININQ